MKKLKKPEILAPAGTLEKLKIACRYGADAVYIGGNAYGLRVRAGNFSEEELTEGVQFAKQYNAKVYVAANMVTHAGGEVGAGQFFQKISDLGVAAAIISDPTLIEICRSSAPDLPIHLSTQMSTINLEAVEFWKNQGVERVVLGREVSLQDLAYIKAHTEMEIEVFVHGAMCIAYSGRCALSNYMSLRDANRGGCSQSCRWKYGLGHVDEVGNYQRDQDLEEFSMSSTDLSMIEHVPDLIKAGVDSFKIEGRMKSIHYVSTTANVYQKAVQTYFADPQNYHTDQALVDELWKVAQRELTTGFYYGDPGVNGQLFGGRRKIPQYKFVGEVIDYDSTKQVVTIRQRNVIEVGDDLEFYGPNFTHYRTVVTKMWNEDGLEIDRAPNPMELITMALDQPVAVGMLIRKKGAGLINLYQENDKFTVKRV